MWHKAAENYAHALELIDYYKKQTVCNKAANTYPSSRRFVPELCKTQEMCDKAVNACFIVFCSVPAWYKSQHMCERIISNDPPFILTYCTR